MTKEHQTQFKLALSRLEKAYGDLKKNHIAFQELEKVSFLTEIIKEQLRQESTDAHEDTHSSVR